MILSILICHLTKRKALLERLMACLQPQIDKANHAASFSPMAKKVVEVLIEEDDHVLSTGAKRNKLLGRARGGWCAAVDDDDLVCPRYIEKVLNALRSNPDCAGIEGSLIRAGQAPRKFVHSIKYDHWYEDKKTGVYIRTPNHLNPVRTCLARQVCFPDLTTAEDHCFSKRLYPLLSSEVFIDGGPIYFYHTV